MTKEEIDFLEQCFKTDNPKEFFVSYEIWDLNINIMKGLKDRGYKFSQSMMFV